MIFSNRVTELREKLSLSKSELADRVGVTTATITNWENWKSTPTRNNLEMLALMLCTTTDYLEGITDDASPEISSAPSAESETTPPATTQPGLCEDCGTPVPERVRKCPSCRWKTRWPESVLNSPKLASRRKRSHSVHLLSLDREKPEAVFGSSTDKNRTAYITTLETCTCRDFEITRGEIPCKHILRLAGELGFFQSEYFAPGEDDYTLHVASEVPDDDSAEYERKLADMAETPPEIPEPVKYLPVVVSEPENLPHKPGIFLRLLKYAACCFLGAIALLFVYGAFVDGRESPDLYCFPVAFVIAGILTASAANLKGEKSVFKWWLYGAFVPLVSWIEVTMLKSEHKAKSFMKGLAYSFAGFVVFAIIASNFRPPMKPKESALPEVSPVVAVVPVSEDVKPESKVSTDAEIAEAQAAYMAELRERERQQKEWEAEQEREQREQEVEKKRQIQEYLKKANTVAVTPKGKKYHKPDCRTVRGSSRTLTVAQARKRGYTPCKVCVPPSQTVTLENSNIYWGDNVYYGEGGARLDVD